MVNSNENTSHTDNALLSAVRAAICIEFLFNNHKKNYSINIKVAATAVTSKTEQIKTTQCTAHVADLTTSIKN